MEIEYRPLTFSEELKLSAAIGSPDQSRQWWARARLYAGVRSVDGRRVHFPQHTDHIRGIVKRLGKDGAAQVARLAGQKRAGDDAPVPVLVARELDEIELLDFFEAFGAAADVRAFAGIAMLACSVREIDGVPVEMPKDIPALTELVDRLGDAGIEAAAEALNAVPERDADADGAAAKN